MTATAPNSKIWLPAMPLEVKAMDDTALTFKGLAAAWSLDLGDDVIHKGAFARTIDHWSRAKKTRPISLLDGHDPFSFMSVIGKVTSLTETDDGLEADFAMIPDDAHAAAAFRRIKFGALNGLSIGYTPVRHDWETTKDGRRIRHLKEVKLHEISLVVFPMNEDARITQVKSLLSSLTTDQRLDVLAGFTEEQKAELRELLATTPDPDPPPAPTPDPEPPVVPEPSPELLALRAKFTLLKQKATDLATRSAARHVPATTGDPDHERHDRSQAEGTPGTAG